MKISFRLDLVGRQSLADIQPPVVDGGIGIPPYPTTPLTSPRAFADIQPGGTGIPPYAASKNAITSATSRVPFICGRLPRIFLP